SETRSRDRRTETPAKPSRSSPATRITNLSREVDNGAALRNFEDLRAGQVILANEPVERGVVDVSVELRGELDELSSSTEGDAALGLEPEARGDEVPEARRDGPVKGSVARPCIERREAEAREVSILAVSPAHEVIPLSGDLEGGPSRLRPGPVVRPRRREHGARNRARRE